MTARLSSTAARFSTAYTGCWSGMALLQMGAQQISVQRRRSIVKSEPAAEAASSAAVLKKNELEEVGPSVSFAEAFRFWVKLGFISFGGPAGQIAIMHRELVERRRWLGEERFLHALNYCMLLPGPEAQQLAIYIGWLLHRTLGGIVAGGLFVVPRIIAIMALSYVYAGWGNVPVIVALFFGLKAAVLAIVGQAGFRIGRRALKNRLMIGLAALAFIGIFFFNVPFPIIVFGAACIGFVGGVLGLAAFQAGNGHGPGGTGRPAVVDAMLGEEIPEHARP